MNFRNREYRDDLGLKGWKIIKFRAVVDSQSPEIIRMNERNLMIRFTSQRDVVFPNHIFFFFFFFFLKIFYLQIKNYINIFFFTIIWASSNKYSLPKSIFTMMFFFLLFYFIIFLNFSGKILEKTPQFGEWMIDKMDMNLQNENGDKSSRHLKHSFVLLSILNGHFFEKRVCMIPYR